VRIRPRGERTLDEVPLTELAAVAEREMTRAPDASVETIARAVMGAYDTRRLTDRIEGLMKRAIDIAKRERAKAATEDEEWARMHRAIAAIPVGRWTALQDLAEFVGTTPGWIGRHLYGKWNLTGLHRVLEPDGRPWRWFQWPEGEARGDVVAVLRAEGAIQGDDSVAGASLRLGVDGLRQLVEA
jgi:alkylated DNA nucleotide flippase Atl1